MGFQLPVPQLVIAGFQPSTVPHERSTQWLFGESQVSQLSAEPRTGHRSFRSEVRFNLVARRPMARLVVLYNLYIWWRYVSYIYWTSWFQSPKSHLCIVYKSPCNLHSLELTVRPWKWMVGIRLFPFGMAYFQVQKVSFRECIVQISWFQMSTKSTKNPQEFDPFKAFKPPENDDEERHVPGFGAAPPGFFGFKEITTKRTKL